ncbi:TPA: fimbrial protein [Aeromonas veronii]|nr:fimbrial protein [Aeromonas veronii]
MNKNLLSITVALSFAAVSVTANAAQITFTGQVNATTCTLEGGFGSDLAMQLPTVSLADVQDVGAHQGAQTLRIPVQCPGAIGGETMTMALMPIAGSINGNHVLKNTAVTDPAANVGIVVLDGSDQLIDFAAGNAGLTTTLDSSGNGDIYLSATYAKTGTATAGSVSAVLPFSMSYK